MFMIFLHLDLFVCLFFSLLLTWLFLCASAPVVSLPPLIGQPSFSHIGIVSHLMYWDLGLQHMHFEGNTIQPIILCPLKNLITPSLCPGYLYPNLYTLSIDITSLISNAHFTLNVYKMEQNSS